MYFVDNRVEWLMGVDDDTVIGPRFIGGGTSKDLIRGGSRRLVRSNSDLSATGQARAEDRVLNAVNGKVHGVQPRGEPSYDGRVAGAGQARNTISARMIAKTGTP